jgi:hypothetical protein
MNLEERKDLLIKKLESLKILGKSTENNDCFIGQCKEEHFIETKINGDLHGIKPGEFIKLKYRDREHISICVGIGLMCKEDPEYSSTKKALWFLEEECSGVSYWRTGNIKDVLRKNVGIELI